MRCRACVWAGILISAAVHAAIAAVVVSRLDSTAPAALEQSIPLTLAMFAEEPPPPIPSKPEKQKEPAPAEEPPADIEPTPLPKAAEPPPEPRQATRSKAHEPRVIKPKRQSKALLHRPARHDKPKAASKPVRASNRATAPKPKTAPDRSPPRQNVSAPPPRDANRSSDRPSAAARSAIERQYLGGLQRAISAQQRYPMSARRMRQRGVVTVAFVLRADGGIGQIRLAKGSGIASLDSAALDALRRLGRYKPIPAALGRRSWTLRVPIRFDLRE